MIIIGYPGVGKSTLSQKHENFIDYDSSLCNKANGWEEEYVKKAIILSDLNYTVCVSAHKKVQELLKDYAGRVVVVYPCLRLHDSWINRLRIRYEKTNDPGDYRALQRCVSNYCEDILELRELPYSKIEIKTEDYDLEEMLNGIS